MSNENVRYILDALRHWEITLSRAMELLEMEAAGNFLMENGQHVTNDASREAALAPYKDALAQISLIAQDRTSYDSENVVTMARLARGALQS